MFRYYKFDQNNFDTIRDSQEQSFSVVYDIFVNDTMNMLCLVLFSVQFMVSS